MATSSTNPFDFDSFGFNPFHPWENRVTGGAVIRRADAAGSSTSSKKKKAIVTLTEPLNIKFEAERVLSGGYLADAAAVHVITISPRRLYITGFKDAGAEKVKKMDVLGQFIPGDLGIIEKVKSCIIKECGSSINNYFSMGDFDLTKVKHVEELPYLKLVHPCNCCNLEGSHSEHYGVVKVGIKEIFNGLLVHNNKQKYVEYHINCQSCGTPLGSVIFSKSKKPTTRLQRGLSKASEWSQENVPLLAAVASGAASLYQFFK